MREFDHQLLRLKATLGVASDQAVAAALGMTKAAFSDRKKRGAFPEDKLRALVTLRQDLLIDPTYVLTGDYLSVAQAKAAAGLNKITSEANGALTQHLPPDEQLLLEAYRGLTAPARKALLAELLTGGKKVATRRKSVSEDAGIKVSGSGHRVAGRDFNERRE